jgi:superfamily II DNA/RNA helicase
MNFSTLGLGDKLCSHLETLGYVKPTQIQELVIPASLMMKDVIATAQTGTGKTAAFLLPLIQMMSEKNQRARLPQVIVLEPTRELALQVHENFTAFAKIFGFTSTLLVGGDSMPKQEKILAKGVDVLIATPGRLMDLVDRGKVMMVGIEHIVIDEADRMLDMGFWSDVKTIMGYLPKRRQILMLSATMAPEIKKLADTAMILPKSFAVSRDNQTADTITQYGVKIKESEKQGALSYIIDKFSPQDSAETKPTIIFCNRKRDISVLVKYLAKRGYKADGLHGDLHQSHRNKILDEFKQGKISILVASDVAARGLDVDALELVINYNPSINPEDYVHRIGRTGRAGKEGISVTLVDPKEEKYWESILKLIEKDVADLDIPKVTVEPEKREKRAKDHPRKAREHNREPRESNRDPVLGFGDSVPAFFYIESLDWQFPNKVS